MSPTSLRRVVVVLAATVGVAACGADAVSPLPVQPPDPTRSTPAPSATSPIPPPAGSPSRPPPSGARPSAAAPPAPTRTRGTPRTTPPPTDATPACQGAVRYDLPLAETEIELLTSLCFGTGAVLRIQGIGPGLVTVDRPDLVAQQYEAGVVDIRFVRTGTVAVTIPKEGREHTITVVVR
ncbi:hypothetical protein EV382_0790 [Micromonospora violae]|uniref:Uncharacterized protein n=1 Tax=Micromonospora violae TaxID=1278207 RepID=A0A4Q7UCA0_9ACTN|nr:hypothetical protein [Micromonospora violae]RZT77641.1 hypothetical protein EV382_0790 [Micromonospora violae]